MTVERKYILRAVALFALGASTVSAFLPCNVKKHVAVSSALPMADFSLDPEETAFVFIEYQNEFCTEGGKLHEAVKECMDETKMLEKSSKLAEYARDSGCTIIHAPISFEKGHQEIADKPYGILANVKEGGAFTSGEWGADFSGMVSLHHLV